MPPGDHPPQQRKPVDPRKRCRSIYQHPSYIPIIAGFPNTSFRDYLYKASVLGWLVHGLASFHTPKRGFSLQNPGLRRSLGPAWSYTQLIRLAQVEDSRGTRIQRDIIMVPGAFALQVRLRIGRTPDGIPPPRCHNLRINGKPARITISQWIDDGPRRHTLLTRMGGWSPEP